MAFSVAFAVDHTAGNTHKAHTGAQPAKNSASRYPAAERWLSFLNKIVSTIATIIPASSKLQACTGKLIPFTGYLLPFRVKAQECDGRFLPGSSKRPYAPVQCENETGERHLVTTTVQYFSAKVRLFNATPHFFLVRVLPCRVTLRLFRARVQKYAATVGLCPVKVRPDGATVQKGCATSHPFGSSVWLRFNLSQTYHDRLRPVFITIIQTQSIACFTPPTSSPGGEDFEGRLFLSYPLHKYALLV